MNHDGMDKECVALCDAINIVPGLQTIESCCGHGEWTFKIWLKVKSLEKLPVLLYFCDPCHIGFRWTCTVETDCAMSPVTFVLESECTGEEAYEQARKITEKVIDYFETGAKD